MRTRRQPGQSGNRGRVAHHKWFNTIATCVVLFGVFWLMGKSNLDRKPTTPTPVVHVTTHHPNPVTKLKTNKM